MEADREDILEVVKAHIAKIPASEKTADVLYTERLAHCQQCEHLISGVCIKCGCYVELRAAFSKQKCPNVKDRKW